VNYESKFEITNLPAVLEGSEYSKSDQASRTHLNDCGTDCSGRFNWPKASNRYQRVARFGDYLFSRIDKLQTPGFDPKWNRSIWLRPSPARSLLRGAGMAGRKVRGAQRTIEDRRDHPFCRIRGPGAAVAFAQEAAIRWRNLRVCSVMEREQRLEVLKTVA